MELTLAERFAHEPGYEPRLDEHGFLADPMSPYGNPRVECIDPASLSTCTIFLGDPGIGKTTLLEQALRAAITARGNERAMHVEMGSVGSEYAFDVAVLHDVRLEQWRNDGTILELFLDGLDESPCSTIADHMQRVLDRLPIPRLRLRLSCRTADWPRGLETFLRERWGDMAVQQVAPLREVDVRMAAAGAGIDADAFLAAIRPSAGALAARPVTLRLFLKLARRKEALPRTREELYRRGCLALCSESNEGRRSRKQVYPFTEGQIFVCAARIAAATVYCNRTDLVESVAEGDERESVFWNQIAPATESIEGEEFPIDAALVRATAGCGLFRAIDPGRVRWAHRTFAEFMAAEYLRTHALRTEQKLDLLLASNGQVVPQLRDTAAWLADMDAGLRRSFIDGDPAAALRSEMSGFTNNDRRALVEALFARHAEHALVLRDLRERDLAGLDHPGLREQLRAHLGTGDAARQLAVTILAATNAEPFHEELIDMVFDPESSFTVRASALDVIAGLPRTRSTGRLAALLPDAIGTDYEGQLRGRLLDLLWPHFIDSGIVFSSLTGDRAAAELFGGAYRRFVLEKLADASVDAAFAEAGLRWVPHRPRGREVDELFETLVSRVLRFGYDHFDREPFATLLPPAIAAELRHVSRSIFPLAQHTHTAPLSDDLRKTLAASVIAHTKPEDRHGLLDFLLDEAGTQREAEPRENELGDSEKSPAAPPSPPDLWGRFAQRIADPEPTWWEQAFLRAAYETRESTIAATLATLQKRFAAAGPEPLQHAAAVYLRHAPRPGADEIASGTAGTVLAALSAIAFLGTDRIDEDVLRGWLPALLVAPEHGADATAWIARIGDSSAIDEFVLALLDRELQRRSNEPLLLSLKIAGRHWNDLLRSALMTRLHAESHHLTYGLILELLLQKNVVDARAEAEQRVMEATAASRADDHAVEAAARLIEETADAGWNVVRSFVQAFPEEESRVLRRCLGPMNAYHLAPKLSGRDVRELARLLLDRHGIAESFTDRTPVQHVALDLVSHLIHRGEVDELIALREHYPALIGGQAIAHAKDALAERQWQAPEPRAVFRMVTDGRRRLVRDGAHLLEILVIALEEIQQSLRGENPQVESLWNADRPKGENDIRNWILDRLKRTHEGLPSLFANKEVEVGGGYYTDIKVEVRSTGSDRGRTPSLHATIEVKGCWHRKLKTAMKDQLLDLYLSDSESPYGIYVVVWFGPEGWTSDDDDRSSCSRWTPATAQAFFDDQARELSTGGTLIRAFVLDGSRTMKKGQS